MSYPQLQAAVAETVGLFFSAAASGEAVAPEKYEELRTKTEAAFADVESELIALRETVALQEMAIAFYTRSFEKVKRICDEEAIQPGRMVCDIGPDHRETCHHVWCFAHRVLSVKVPELSIHKRARKARVAIAAAKRLLDKVFVPGSSSDELQFVRARITEYEEVR